MSGNTRDVAVSVVLPVCQSLPYDERNLTPSQLLLDLSVLFVTLKHALSLPDGTFLSISDVLVNDGFSHFLVVFLCRLGCLVIVVAAPVR